MHVEVVTLFPEMVRGALRFGVVGRALERGLLSVGHGRSAVAHARCAQDRGRPALRRRPRNGAEAGADAGGDSRRAGAAAGGLPAHLPVGAGRGARARRWRGSSRQLPGFVLVAGRYEGLDERVIELGIDRELSIGDYVLSGGELPALVVIDAVARLLPGVLGRRALERARSPSRQGCSTGRTTRGPRCSRVAAVPQVLLSGNHADIARWRLQQAVARTWQRRPDLIVKHGLSRRKRAGC